MLADLTEALFNLLLRLEPPEWTPVFVETEAGRALMAAAALGLSDNALYGVRFAIFYVPDKQMRFDLAALMARSAPRNLKTFYPEPGELAALLEAVKTAQRNSPREDLEPAPAAAGNGISGESNLSSSGNWANVALYAVDAAVAVDPLFYFVDRAAYVDRARFSILRFCGSRLTADQMRLVHGAYGHKPVFVDAAVVSGKAGNNK